MSRSSITTHVFSRKRHLSAYSDSNYGRIVLLWYLSLVNMLFHESRVLWAEI